MRQRHQRQHSCFIRNMHICGYGLRESICQKMKIKEDRALGPDRFETDGYQKQHNIFEGSLTREDLETDFLNSAHVKSGEALRLVVADSESVIFSL